MKVCDLPKSGKWITYPECTRYKTGYSVGSPICSVCKQYNGSKFAIEKLMPYKKLNEQQRKKLNPDYLIAIDNAISALEKQVPQRPILREDGKYHCACCDARLPDDALYCGICGQFISGEDKRDLIEKAVEALNICPKKQRKVVFIPEEHGNLKDENELISHFKQWMNNIIEASNEIRSHYQIPFPPTNENVSINLLRHVISAIHNATTVIPAEGKGGKVL